MRFIKLLLFMFPLSLFGDAVVFIVQSDATIFQSQIDTANGYPKAGVNVGGGIHVSVAQGTTAHHSDVKKHPTLNQWSVNTPGVSAALVTATGKVSAPLTSDWFPVRPGTP